jgi:hypothetical protein
MKTIIRIVIVQILVLFIITFLVSLSMPYPDFPKVTISGRFMRSLEWFFEMLPTALIAAFIVGVSLEFGHTDVKKLPRFSSLMFAKYRFVLILSLVFIFLSLFAVELGSPLVRQRQEGVAARQKFFDEYLGLAQKYIDQENYELGLIYVQEARILFPDSEEAGDLYNLAESKFAAAEAQIRRSAPSPAAQTALPSTLTLPEDVQYTGEELIQKAQNSFDQGDWFDAHYFAELAIAGATISGQEHTLMRRISEDAWQRLSSPEIFKNDEASALFLRKKEGYTALIGGDFLKAYYLFYNLNELHPRDNDVIHYYEEAIQQVRERYFFLDEVSELAAFETAHDAYFALARPDGGRDIVYCRGITEMKDTGGTVQYLRQFNLSSYDRYGIFEKSIEAPYVKLIENSGNTPLIMLVGIDRNKEGIMSQPVYTFADPAKESPDNIFLYLNLSYDNLSRILDASAGAERMSLPSLYRFVPLASQYGFSSEVYLQALLLRLCYPFILLILYLAYAILAWNYRLGRAQIFKFHWLVMLPVLTGVVYFLLECIRYVVKLLNYSFIGMFSTSAIFAAAGVMIGMIIILSVRFLSLRSAG